MASNAHDSGIRSTDPKVRSACDRCRSQKLKCDQSLTLNDAGKCSRCVKSRSDCTTSAPRPSGRPSRQQSRHQVKSRKPNQLLNFEAAQPGSSSAMLATDDSISHSTVATALSLEPELASAHFDVLEASMFAPFPTEAFSFGQSPLGMSKEHPSTASYGMNQELQHDVSMLELDFSSGSMSDLWLKKGIHPHLFVNQNKSHHLKKLAALNSLLLQHLSAIDKLVYGDCCRVESLMEHQFPSQHSSLHSHHPNSDLDIKAMLKFLQEFTSIIGSFLMFSPITAAPRLTSYLDGAEDETKSDCSDIDFEERPLPEGPTDGNHCWTDHDVPSATEQATRDGGSASGPLIDYPTILALTTCYVSLVRLLRSAFERILSALEVSSKHESVPSYKTLPPLIPDLDMAGFSLNMHRSIQISVFMHVALDLLWRAEKGMTAIAAAERDGTSTTSSGHMELLKTMLKQEAATAGPSTQKIRGGAIGRQSLKILAGQIRSLCRGHVCLQLEETTFPVDIAGATFDAGMDFSG